MVLIIQWFCIIFLDNIVYEYLKVVCVKKGVWDSRVGCLGGDGEF